MAKDSMWLVEKGRFSTLPILAAKRLLNTCKDYAKTYKELI
jgi:hypothetical protein